MKVGFILNIFQKVVSSVLVCSLVLPVSIPYASAVSVLKSENDNITSSIVELKIQTSAPIVKADVTPVVAPIGNWNSVSNTERAGYIEYNAPKKEVPAPAPEAPVAEAPVVETPAPKVTKKPAPKKEVAPKEVTPIIAETSETSNTTSENSEISDKLIAYAKKFIGTPYVYGGSSPRGFDCSGFTGYVYKSVGISLARSSSAQYSTSIKVSKENLKPGDLVFFNCNGRGVSHVGMYIGNGNMIHSPRTGSSVKIDSINSNYYSKRFVSGGRFN
ncbi:MAG: NlpC/P60 family protein [Carnobacterium sp.]